MAERASSCVDISHLKLEEIPRLAFGDPALHDYFSAGLPVVIEGSGLVQSAVDNWTMDYLEDHIGEANFTVYNSPGQFLYSRSRIPGKELYAFESEVQSAQVPFDEFRQLLRQPRVNADGSTRPLYYLQQSLFQGVGERVVRDFGSWKWDWIAQLTNKYNWGKLTTNLFLVGEAGTITPLHYDEQENLFAQLRGRKRFILYPPSDFSKLYPFPLSHPADRQSQVDILAPNTERFPRFEEAVGHHALLGPGDVLFLPNLWWHHVSSPWEETMSVNFWFAHGKETGAVELPIRDVTRLVSLRRNIEKLLMNTIGPVATHELFAALDAGGMLPTPLIEGFSQAVSLLLNVLEPGDVVGFLHELAKNRFKHLVLELPATAAQAAGSQLR